MHRPSDRDVNWMSPVQGESPLCRLKNPTVISILLLVGFHPATRSVQSTPADNTGKRVWQYIEKEIKERQTDRQTDRQAGSRQTDRQAGRQAANLPSQPGRWPVGSDMAVEMTAATRLSR